MFAAIWIPSFCLQAAQRWRDEPPAVAVIDGTQNRALILDVSPAARREGVHAGMTAAQGLARCPALRILQRSLSQEAACSALIVEAGFGFSPRVEATAPDTATLDLTTAPKNTCWQQLGDQMIERLKTEALDVAVGFAPNADHALLAAQYASPVHVVYDGAVFCANLPVSALTPDARMLTILNDWGIRTIGEFLKLPKAEMVARLGTDATRMWKQASGRHKRALRVSEPTESFMEAFEFEYPVETTEPLLFLLRRFLDSLCARIRAQHRVVGRIQLTLPLDDGACHVREFAVPAPTTLVEVLYRIIDTHIETLRLEQQPVGIRLALVALAPLGRQLALFEKGLRDPNGFGETLARLKAVVGDGSVGMPAHADTHRPEVCVVAEFEESGAITALPVEFGLPLRRLRPPAPIGVRLLHRQPVWIDAPRWAGPVQQVAGPYRFSGDWWSGAPWAIEEWDAQIEGRGLVRLGRRGELWTIEGIYNLSHGCLLY